MVKHMVFSFRFCPLIDCLTVYVHTVIFPAYNFVSYHCHVLRNDFCSQYIYSYFFMHTYVHVDKIVNHDIYVISHGTGQKGEMGERGVNGTDGAVGPAGDPGDPGATGQKGEIGDPGPQGDTGQRGDTVCW